MVSTHAAHGASVERLGHPTHRKNVTGLAPSTLTRVGLDLELLASSS